MSDQFKISSPAGALTFHAHVGNIGSLVFHASGSDREINALHTAHWVGKISAADVEGLLPVEEYLSGDFFCAPFAGNDLLDGPAHGWSANSDWTITKQATDRITARLGKDTMGAAIEKVLLLAPDAPLLYQRHDVIGGEGELPVAHHPMVRLKGRGRLSCSAKEAALTHDEPLESGQNRLATGQFAKQISDLKDASGAPIDICDLPIGQEHEDFVVLIEASHSQLGWSAVTREEEDDIIFFLKDPKVLPFTMLWHSNGARKYRPWDGRHNGVLGIEDGCAAGVLGHKAALGDNPIKRAGAPTTLRLEPEGHVRINHVIGAIPRPAGWDELLAIEIKGDQLILTGSDKTSLTLPFRADFFKGQE